MHQSMEINMAIDTVGPGDYNEERSLVYMTSVSQRWSIVLIVPSSRDSLKCRSALRDCTSSEFREGSAFVNSSQVILRGADAEDWCCGQVVDCGRTTHSRRTNPQWN